MLNPKRLLLLIVGFAFFFGCYLVYGFFLGQYDGLPPLPPEFKYQIGEPTPAPRNTDVRSHAVELLREAFGPTCEEQHRRLKLEWRSQGIVMAADSWKILHNGQLRLYKVSVALVNQPKTTGAGKEINTIKGDQADVEFDQPLQEKSLMRDAQSRRPVGGKISGNVHLRNNRRTPNPDDDVHLYTSALAYNDVEHRIWTKTDVRIVDSEAIGSSPQAVITGTGMEVLLEAEERPEKKPGKGKATHKVKDKKTTITGVRSVRLEKNVCMDLLIDAHSAFLGAAPAGPAGGKKAGDKSPVVINSRGPFIYTVAPDPDAAPDQAEFSELVNVIRKQVLPLAANAPDAVPAVRYDQLDCDHLTLLFNRRSKPAGQKKPTPPGDGARPDDGVHLDLVSAKATGKQVELVSDSEALHATGVVMIYDRARGQTILQGDPVEAEKDGHQMLVRGTLTFSMPEGENREVRDAHAQGPGSIRMKSDKSGVTRIARWNKELIAGKDGLLDKLVFKELASFEDSEHGRLQGDQLTVWLASRAKTKRKDAPPNKPGVEDQMALRRLEALGNVALRSQDLIIHRAEQVHLQVEEGELAQPAAPPSPSTSPAKTNNSGLASPRTKDQPVNTPAQRKRPPLELTARTVDARTIADGKRTELKTLNAEGQVQVQQKPVTLQDKLVDIRGDRITLRHETDGNVLTVVGQPGFVQMDKLTIIGPVVTLDQLQNVATVEGSGSLRMPARTDFEGTALKEPAEVTIYWGQRMFFDGQLAEFDQAQVGRVQVTQGDAKLACRMLQVVLDRRVSLKDKQPGQGDQPVALHKMLCNEDVRLEKGIKRDGKWLDYQRVEGAEAVFENPLGELRVFGPGVVHVLRKGTQQSALIPAGAGKPAPTVEEMKLTRVQFQGTMVGNKNTGAVKFWDGISLVHLPAEDPDLAINPDQPAPGSMTLKCNQLNASQRKVGDKVVSQELEAIGRVTVKAQNYHGLADVVKYDESNDRLIFEGHNNNLARLYRQLTPGAKPDDVSAKKIWFFRKENRVQLRETEAIQVNPGR